MGVQSTTMLMLTQEPVNASFHCSGSVPHPSTKMHERVEKLEWVEYQGIWTTTFALVGH